MLQLDSQFQLSREVIHSPNLCDRFTDHDLAQIGNYCWEGFVRDKNSRSVWERRNEAAMDLAMQVQQAKTFPWPGCSNVVFPLVTIGGLQFSSQAYPNIVQGNKVCRYRTIGRDIGPVRERALRIGRHMSYQLLEEDEGWEEQMDRLLINLAIVGCNFLKTYYHSSKGHPTDELVLARDLVMDYGAKSIETCARKTHIIPMYRNEIYERCRRGTFRVECLDEAWFKGNAPLPANTAPGIPMNAGPDRRQGVIQIQNDRMTKYIMLEQHVGLDCDGDGYEEPYLITLDAASKKVTRIAARIDSEEQIERHPRSREIICIKPTEYFTKFSFIPSPDGSIYDIGFGILLGPLNESVNSGINQLLDQGTLQNAGGGFLGKGVKVRGGVYTVAPGEWKRVDSTGDDLRKNIVPFPDRTPSTVTYQLTTLLIDYANRIMGTTEAMVGESPGQNMKAATFEGMTEEGRKTFNWIFKRVWRSMRESFKKRYLCNRHFLPAHKDFGDGDAFIRREDYLGSPDSVAPVANPQVTSTTIRVRQAMAVKEDSMRTPGYDMMEVTRTFLAALDLDEQIDRLYPGPGKVPPLPNPRAAVEQMKNQREQMKLSVKKWEVAQQLVVAHQETMAKIELMKAQAAKLIADIGADKAAHQLETFETIMQALTAHGEMINERIGALTQKGDEEENPDAQQTAQPPGVPGMDPEPSNPGLPGLPSQVPAQSNGAMGGGSVPVQ